MREGLNLPPSGEKSFREDVVAVYVTHLEKKRWERAPGDEDGKVKRPFLQEVVTTYLGYLLVKNGQCIPGQRTVPHSSRPNYCFSNSIKKNLFQKQNLLAKRKPNPKRKTNMYRKDSTRWNVFNSIRDACGHSR